jgi:enterobactin synthetase component D
MLFPLPNPPLFSTRCHLFSARLESAIYEPGQTPQELGIKLPPPLIKARAVRQAEYLGGRFVALKALAQAGYAGPPEIGTRSDRSPIWPAGFVGSITHTLGYVSAVVAKAEEILALGLDSERILDESAARDVQAEALGADEMKLLGGSGLTMNQYVGVIFSAKESLFKALYPLVQKYFEFNVAEAIEISPGEIRFRLRSDLGGGWKSGAEVRAKFIIDERIHTGVELSARH